MNKIICKRFLYTFPIASLIGGVHGNYRAYKINKMDAILGGDMFIQGLVRGALWPYYLFKKLKN